MPAFDSAKKRRIRSFRSMWRHQKAIERVEDRLTRVETLCANTERDIRKLDLEFTDLYDKVKRQMSRMAKRYAVDQKENGEEFNEIPDNSPSDSLDPISRSIMLRRARGAVKE